MAHRTRVFGLAVGLSLGATNAVVAQGGVGAPRVLDDFTTVAGWTAHPSDGTSLTITADQGYRGNAMKLDFDFHGGGGYVIARKEIPISWPANYELTFRIRGEARRNNLEVKFVDRSGDNVWWVNTRDFEFPLDWRTVTLKKRHISFAWGPSGGGELKESAAIEIAITAGNGGSGTVWIDDLVLTPLDPVVAYTRTPSVRATTSTAGNAAVQAIDGKLGTSWRSRTADGPARPGVELATLAVDFLQTREIGGLTVHWGRDDFATSYRVEISRNGTDWKTVYDVRGGNGGRDYIPLPETETRHVRLMLQRSNRGRGYEVAEVDVKPLEWTASPNDFIATIAKDDARGSYPKYFSGVQSYWTIIGVSGDEREAMINEEGMIETGKAQFSIEPFLYVGGKLLTWADAKPVQSLERGDLPIPSVNWDTRPIDVAITGYVTGAPGESVLHARYRATNRATSRQTATLYLALRPFQVNPSWQFLNTSGGVASIRSLIRSADVILVNRTRAVIPVSMPSSFGAAGFDQGNIVDFLRRNVLPRAASAGDSLGYASGALAYALELAPNETRDVYVAVPLYDLPESALSQRAAAEPPPTTPPPARPDAPVQPPAVQPALFPATPAPGAAAFTAIPGHLRPAEASAYGEQQLSDAIRDWSAALDKVGIQLPPAAERVARVIRSNLAYILINRDGPSIQPGSRSYERSWIRDGALTSAALLRLGHAKEVREFIEWYAPYQFANGKVPCCVDHRGADPVPEHDSHGELIYLIAEYHRFTRDTAFLMRMWPHVARAVGYIDSLRAQRMTDEYRTGAKRAYYGLVPQSISHEGYSAKPMHSYWDDAFILRGLKDATSIAAILGKRDTTAIFAAKRDEFRRNLMDSYRLAMQMHGIDYLPGSVELGDFDATSTTVAVAPGGEIRSLPQPALDRTFQKYLDNFRGRRDGTVASDAYTPYELRTVGTFVRLGQRNVAHELLDFFFRDQRPAAWNHWAEVVWKDPATPKFIGDMPHTWVGSDYIRSVTDMLAYEREEDDALIVGAGIVEPWVTSAPGVSVRELATHYGPLSFTMSGTASEARVRIDGGLRMPPGGVVIQSPYDRPIVAASVDGAAAAFTGAHVVVRRVPAEVVIRY